MKVASDFIYHFQNGLNVPRTEGTKQHTGHALQNRTKERKKERNNRRKKRKTHSLQTHVSSLPKSEILFLKVNYHRRHFFGGDLFSRSHTFICKPFEMLGIMWPAGMGLKSSHCGRQGRHDTSHECVGMLLPRV